MNFEVNQTPIKPKFKKGDIIILTDNKDESQITIARVTSIDYNNIYFSVILSNDEVYNKFYSSVVLKNTTTLNVQLFNGTITIEQ